jgi:arylsulfatase A-like enzyme
VRRGYTLGLLLLVAAAGALWYRRSPPTPATPYNVLLISLDTVRQDFLGSYGHRPRHAPDLSPSPNLDRLAAEGVRMADAYAPSSWTLPSHISLLTGTTPLVHGVETEVITLDPSLPIMAEILGRHGYRTFGLYTAPYVGPHWGFARGFESYRGMYPPEVTAAEERSIALGEEIEQVAAAGDWRRYDELKRQKVAVDQELNQRSQEAVTSAAVAGAVIERLRELKGDPRPWFGFVHLFDPHCDYVPPPPYDTRFDPDYRGSASGKGCLAGPEVAQLDPVRPGGVIRTIGDRDLEHVLALYEGEIAWVDEHVGRILAALDDLGLTQRTLVIVVSDHGEEFFEHGGLGHRNTLYEEVTRVPMILRLPGVLPVGAALRGPVSLADVMPTVLEMIGLDDLASEGGGESFLGLVRGEEDAADRSVLGRLVVMYGGNVQVDGARDVLFRQVVVQDAFRTGGLKISRRRSWPQFAADAGADLQAVLASAAGEQYGREELEWVDLAAAPAEPDGSHSRDFTAGPPRAALDEFRRRYRDLLAQRKTSRISPLPQNVRDALERLGYGDSTGGAQFPEPDVVLPPPG